MRYKSTKVVMRNISECLIAFFILFVFLAPVVWIALSSFKTNAQILQIPPKFIFSPTLTQYVSLFQETNFFQNLLNSLSVATSSGLISLVVGTLGAYGIARARFRGKDNLDFWILSIRLAPPFAFVVPFYLIMRDLHLLDTRTALVILYMTFNIPFVVWMMKGFFSEIPAEIEEAALVDGCSRLDIFLRISLPLVRPGLVASFIFCLILSWNEFLFAFSLTRSSAQTLPVAIATFVGLMGIKWGQMAAAGVITTVPIFIFAFIIQKHLLRGLTLGAIK